MDLESQGYYGSGFEAGKQNAKAEEQSAKTTAVFLKFIGHLLFICFIYSAPCWFLV